MRRFTLRLTWIVALGYMAVVTALYLAQDRLIHVGWAGPAPQAVAAIPGLTEISVESDAGYLRGWHRPAASGRPTLIVFHGNGGFYWRRLDAFAQRGWGILLVPYRGYAGNPGAPDEAGLMEDGRAVLAHARGVLGLPAEDILLYGESLGTGVAARMALEPGGWRGLILVAPYTSVEDRAAELYPWVPVRTLLRDRFATDEIIARVEAPILIVHGTSDPVIPVAHGRALAALAPETKTTWIDGAGHILPVPTVTRAIAEFLGTG
ncbi:alpha/beta hydrolase [Jannaschia aquimarina]|nr:alpha/beta hydrolase [Jannaschia aquimarina]